MIDARELRIGNLITANNAIYKVVSLAFSNPQLQEFQIQLTNQDLNSVIMNFDSISFTPLSEDVLLKCGFENEIYFNSGNDFNYTNEVFYIDETNTITVIFDKVAKKFFINIILIDNNQDELTIEVLSVHQLQNLYFALTGKELDVKL